MENMFNNISAEQLKTVRWFLMNSRKPKTNFNNFVRSSDLNAQLRINICFLSQFSHGWIWAGLTVFYTILTEYFSGVPLPNLETAIVKL